MPAREDSDHRTCLLVAEPGPTRDAMARALGEAGYRPRAVTGGDAIHALENVSCVAVLASQEIGAQPLSQITDRAAMRRPPVPVVVLGPSSGGPAHPHAPAEPETAVRRLHEALKRRPSEAESEEGPPGLVGRSRAMRALVDRISRISRYKTNVLLLGESGTGKELVARALHAEGPRREHPFVPLNCAAISREIIENEIFGHERGAFTGANERKKGIFEVADGGTLFLDEIAEMELSTQGKLLRVLERNEFRRLGGTTKVKVDVSVIAATNRDLHAAVDEGRFREDLYYRLRVVAVVVPPLRDRKEDIPALARKFVEDFNERNGAALRALGPRVLERLSRHDWPGNVRELKNTIESVAVLTRGDTVSLDAVEDAMDVLRLGSSRRGETRAASSNGGDLLIRSDATLADAERQLILAAVARCRTKEAAARSLGIGVRTLFTKLRQYERPPRTRRAARRRPRSS